MQSTWFFYLLAGCITGLGILTVSSRNILHAAMSLVGCFFFTAIFFLSLHSEFLAIAQIMVYIGGVVVFVVFTILLTSHLGEAALLSRAPRHFTALILIGGLIYMFHRMLSLSPELRDAVPDAPANYASLEAIGMRLLNPHDGGFVVPFEVISLLLLCAMVGAITLARKGDEEDAP